MTKKVFIIERSPLATNIYYMLLSKLHSVDVVNGQLTEAIPEIKRGIVEADLVLISESTLADRKDEFYKLIESVRKKSKTPIIILLNEKSVVEETGFSRLTGVEILKKPFFPKEFLEIVKKAWGLQ